MTPTPNESGWRECKRCHKELVITDFEWVAHKWRRHTCRWCRGITAAKYYQTHKTQHAIKTARSREKHPEKYKARVLVKNLIHRGKLKREPCEVCQEPNGQAHHTDYSKPLLVTWLCPRHHGEQHRLEK